MSILNNKWFSFLLGSRDTLPLFLAILTCLGISVYLGQLLPQLIAELFESYEGEELFFLAMRWLLFIYLVEYVNRVCYTISTTRYIKHVLLHIRLYCYRSGSIATKPSAPNRKAKSSPWERSSPA